MPVFGYDDQSPVDKFSLMSHKLRIGLNERDLAIGTGFFIRSESAGEIYLVTNWHNVTGRRTDTHECMRSDLAVPDSLTVCCVLQKQHPEQTSLLCKPIELAIPLYEDDERLKPRWLEHGELREKVDVVLLPVSQKCMKDLPEGTKLSTLNRGDNEIQVAAGMDVVILGYPRGLSGGQFPIWKSGSIASEPYYPIDGLPKFYVDTATREGMSGAPVFACASGSVRFENGIVGQANATVRRFLGVYSGRVGADELGAQLGVVWKESVIADIIGFGVQGQASCELIPKAP